jgi:hypothetical protein
VHRERKRMSGGKEVEITHDNKEVRTSEWKEVVDDPEERTNGRGWRRRRRKE